MYAKRKVARRAAGARALAGGLGDEVGVDHKTVERWIGGRAPYRKHRYTVAKTLAWKRSTYGRTLCPATRSRQHLKARSWPYTRTVRMSPGTFGDGYSRKPRAR